MKIKLGLTVFAMVMVLTGCGMVDNMTRMLFDSSQTEAEGYSFGVFTDTGYESKYLGYRFTTPEGCFLSSQETLVEMSGLSADLLAEDYDDIMVEYMKKTVIYDLGAQFEKSGTSLLLNVQATKTIPVKNFTLDMVVESGIQQLEALGGADVTVLEEREIVKIAGNEYVMYKVHNDVQGVLLIQEVYTSIFSDNIVSIVISYIEENEADSAKLLAAFEEL